MELNVILDRNFIKISDEYRAFAQEKDKCKKCSINSFYSLRPGQSEGNAVDPTFMFIGEGLGETESKETRPFIGKSGQRLRSELRKHNQFNKLNTLISNVLTCRPKDNKFPKESEKYTADHLSVNGRTVVEFCAENWLFKEIKLLKPKVIVTLGSIPLDFVFNKKGISDNRGEWHFSNKFRCWTFSTYHPSYVLRCANDVNKKFIVNLFEQDIKKIAETWKTLVNSDIRMSMSDESWLKQKAVQTAVRKKMLPPEYGLIND